MSKIDSEIELIVIDLFCGAGGVTTGFINSKKAVVAACINHDAKAIESHALNHPDCRHFVENIVTFNIALLLPIIADYKRKYPHAKVVLWASAECTNFSDAKGGMPRDADSRSLPLHLVGYVDMLQPDLFCVENVREFMAWGEMDENNRPISRKNGLYYLRWVKSIEEIGYHYDFQILNAADFGAYQSRERYFGIFAKNKAWIRFPKQTHAKKLSVPSNIFDNEPTIYKHKAVRDVLDLKVIGNSIFDRPKPLSDNTLMRILRGLQKYGFREQFIMRNNNPGYNRLLNEPIGTITCKDTNYLISPSEKTDIQWIDRQYGRGTQFTELDKPVGTLTTKNKTSLATANFIFNPQFANTGNSIEAPCPTMIAAQGKRPLQLATIEFDAVTERFTPQSTDSDTMKLLKAHCLEHGISNVFLRQLNVKELLRIQGFPDNYQLIGNKAEQGKFIGNAVEVNMATALALALAA